jgi:hypothetical protein
MVRLRLLPWLTSFKITSLSGRGTILSTGIRSNRRNLRSFSSSASGVDFGRNWLSSCRQIEPRSSAPAP